MPRAIAANNYVCREPTGSVHLTMTGTGPCCNRLDWCAAIDLQSVRRCSRCWSAGLAVAAPTFEDKVLQRAVAMVIGEVYEQSFHDFSYGFRPGRSAHQALQAIRNAAWRMKGGWIVEVDIRKFFDTVDHPQC